LKRPKLLGATTPLFGGNRDNFLPRSGCGWGRGFVRGFPDAEITTWRRITEEADGNFYQNHGGTMRFALASALNVVEETMRTNPQELLENPPKMATPYETWSYMNPENRTTYGKLRKVFADLKAKLIGQYKKRGMSEKDAGKAADSGIAQVVWGAGCGDAPPPQSFRKLVGDGASAAELRAFFQSGEYRDRDKLGPFTKCAEHGGMDPLIHLAVVNPKAMLVLWEEKGRIPADDAKDLDFEVDPNATNGFGKTPLMAAAQQDAVEAADLLLEHGASPFRTTMKTDEFKLHHDARTALMYAAARGSLPMIKLLLEAGADKYAADTTGQTALHWLLGHGPMAPNPRLSDAERAEAVKLLY